MPKNEKAPWSASPNARAPWWLWPQVVSLDGAMVAASWAFFLPLAVWEIRDGHTVWLWSSATIASVLVGFAALAYYTFDRWLDARKLAISSFSHWPFRYREHYFAPLWTRVVLLNFCPILFVFGADVAYRQRTGDFFLGPALGGVFIVVVFVVASLATPRRWGLRKAFKELFIGSVFALVVLLAFAEPFYLRFDGYTIGFPFPREDPAKVGGLFLALCLCSAFHSSLHQREDDRVLGFESLATRKDGEAAYGVFLVMGLITQWGWWLAFPVGPAIAVTGLLLLLTSPLFLRVDSQTGTMVGDYAMTIVPLVGSVLVFCGT